MMKSMDHKDILQLLKDEKHKFIYDFTLYYSKKTLIRICQPLIYQNSHGHHYILQNPFLHSISVFDRLNKTKN
jgi:hypothetical protein